MHPNPTFHNFKFDEILRSQWGAFSTLPGLYRCGKSLNILSFSLLVARTLSRLINFYFFALHPTPTFHNFKFDEILRSQWGAFSTLPGLYRCGKSLNILSFSVLVARTLSRLINFYFFALHPTPTFHNFKFDEILRSQWGAFSTLPGLYRCGN